MRLLKTNKIVLLFLFLLLVVLLLSGCGAEKDVTQATTAMQAVYYRVYNATVDAWGTANLWTPLLWAAFWAILVMLATFFAIAGSNSRQNTAGCFISGSLAAIVFLSLWIYLGWKAAAATPAKADKQAVHAMREGFDQAKYDKANIYVEVIHAPVVGLTPEEKTCQASVNWPSNCSEYEWTHEINHREVCTESTDSDGKVTESCHEESDTEHVPFFKKLVRYLVYVHVMEKLATTPEAGFIATPGRVDTPHRYLSPWMTPPDYDNWWYKGGFAARRKLAPSDYTPPAEWQRYSDMLYVQKKTPLVNFYHRYPNWLFAADAVLFKQFEGDLQKYADLGILPTMKTIYSRTDGWAADYDFVQFVGGLKISPEENFAWQDAAYAYSSFFSNDRQGSLAIVFAPASKVDDMDKWADSVKAHYSQRGKWDMRTDAVEAWQRLLPKNTFILACKVDEAARMVPADGCRLRTGMPHGNEEIIDTFAYRWNRELALQNVIFTPTGFFGNVWSEPIDPDGDGFFEVSLHREETKPMDILLRDDPLGARRVSMKTFDYLQSDIKLDAADIDKLVAKEIAVQQALASSKLLWAIAAFVIEVFIIGSLFVLGASRR